MDAGNRFHFIIIIATGGNQLEHEQKQTEGHTNS